MIAYTPGARNLGWVLGLYHWANFRWNRCRCFRYYAILSTLCNPWLSSF